MWSFGPEVSRSIVTGHEDVLFNKCELNLLPFTLNPKVSVVFWGEGGDLLRVRDRVCVSFKEWTHGVMFSEAHK